MAQYTGPGVAEIPVQTPIADLIPRGTASYGNEQDVLRAVVREAIEGIEVTITPTWNLFLAALIRAIQQGVTPTTGPLYVDLTPADNVIPELELVEEGGTLGVVLDRALTTIDPATDDGLVPEDGYKFTLKIFNDATDGRELAFDAVYHGAQTSSGVALAVESYTFTTIAGEFWIDAQEIGIL